MFKKTLFALILLAVLGGIAATCNAAPLITSIARRNPNANSSDTEPVISPTLLGEGAVLFVDRTHIMAIVPPRMLGAEYVRTANDDKDNPNHELDVTIGQACLLYLLIDNRMGDNVRTDPPNLTAAGMSWVTQAGFTLTQMTVENDENADGSLNNTFGVYVKPVTPGTYTLYGQNNGGSRNMYVVAAALPPTKALNPTPVNGSTITTGAAVLSWEPGTYAAQHHLFFSAARSDVESRLAAADKGYTPAPPHIMTGLVPGTTYYWAVDEVNNLHPDSPWAGDVWSFSVMSGKASNPTPIDGAKYLPTNVQLAWSPGYQSSYYEVYHGTNYDTVNSATTPNATIVPATHSLTGLSNNTTYYWRVDAIDQSLTKHKGDVWTFSVIPVITIQDPNLVAWYKFDAGYGTKVLDWSGHGRDGTISGTVNWVSGLFDGALDFIGDNGGYVEMPAASIGLTNSKGSVAMWVNSTQIDDEGHIWYACDETGGDGFGGQDEMHVNMDDDGGGIIRYWVLGTDGGTGTNISLNSPWTPADAWVHVAATWSEPDGMRFYINGVQVGSAPHNNPGNLKTYVRLRLGHANSGDRYYDGMIDDFRLFNRAITPAEVIAAMRGDRFVAWNPKPGNGAVPDIEAARPLAWTPGDGVAMHDVYFSTDMAAVEAATTFTSGVYVGRQGPNTYDPGALGFGGTYYWRVDEVEPDGVTIHKGYTWTFTTLDHIVLEDFESYGDSTVVGAAGSRMWYTWRDGYGWTDPTTIGGNGTGSLIGNWPPPVAETAVIHGGRQAMPFWYDNSGTGADALGTLITAKYSEATRTFAASQDFIRNGLRALSVWYRGFPGEMGALSVAGNQYTLTGAGADIWNMLYPGQVAADGYHDEFHYVYKQVSTGVFTLKVKVESVQNTNAWSKAGIMIRATLDGGSPNALLAVTPGNGTTTQIRTDPGGTTTSTRDPNFTAPLWIRISRNSVGDLTSSFSSDNINWTTIPVANNLPVPGFPIYIGLAVTSHSSGNPCTAVFSNFTMDDVAVTGLQHQDIGILSNDKAPLYMALTDSLGRRAVVNHPDPDAVLVTTWAQWNIDMAGFSGGGVDLAKVSKISLGVGIPGSTTPGGSGKLYFDDIALYPPRYIPGMGTPLATDLNGDGTVDFRDARIVGAEWLRSDYTAPPLLSWYKLDGNGLDSSGNNHHADPCSDPGGRVPLYAASMPGFTSAVDVNGGGDYLISRNAGAYMNGLDAVTIMAWIKSDVVDTDKGFIDFQTPNGNDSRDLRYDAAGASGGGINVIKVGVTTTAGEQKLESQSNVQTTNWQHVAITWSSGQNIKLYIDGVENAPTWREATRLGSLTGYSALHIGKGAKDNSAASSWAGLIDDVRIYDKVLTPAELTSVLNGTLGTVSNYHPLVSAANLSDNEPANSKMVNFRDLAVMLSQWRLWQLWPQW